jgi:hypothetical protein
MAESYHIGARPNIWYPRRMEKLIGLMLLCATPALAKGTGSEAEARALLSEWVKPGANAAELSKKLAPTKADYAAVFAGDAAAKVEAVYGPAWAGGQIVIQGKPEQTALLINKSTTDELKAGTGNANAFPGGYKGVAQHFKPGLIIYAFKFVKPGETLGMAYDGLVWVNGRFVIFPKPWRALR